MAAVATLRKGPPLDIAPAESVGVAPGVSLCEAADRGAVFVWGMVVSCWDATDVVGRRLAAVQLVETRSAGHAEVAAGFGVGSVTLWRWRQAWQAGGVAGLVPRAKGPKRPSKLTEAKVAEIRSARAEGLSMRAVATRVGVSADSVLRALGPRPVTDTVAGRSAEPGELEPLARPEPRTEEREAAARGELAEANPVICEGASLPLVGALVILPALAATGLVEVAEATYTRARAAFYGLGSLVLTMVFTALWGEPRAEGLTRLDPVDAGRVLGLDRAPEVKTIRRRLGRLAGEHKADRLLAGLARRHAATHDEAMGVLYVDGHVRAYHGAADVPKAHVARIRLSMLRYRGQSRPACV